MAVELLKITSPGTGDPVYFVGEEVAAIIGLQAGGSAVLFKGASSPLQTDIHPDDIAELVIAGTGGRVVSANRT